MSGQVESIGGFLLTVLGAIFAYIGLKRSNAKDRAEADRARKAEIKAAVDEAVAACNASHAVIEAGLRDTMLRSENAAARDLAAMTSDRDYHRGRSDSLQDRLDGLLARVAPTLSPAPPPRGGHRA